VIVRATTAFDREVARAQLYLTCVLPLVETVLARRPERRKALAGARAVVQLEVPGTDAAAHLMFDETGLRVVAGRHAGPVALRATWKDLRGLTGFFTGGSPLPSVKGLLLHPLLTLRVGTLMNALCVLDPETPVPDPADRALKVELVLYLITRSVAELHRLGHPDTRALAHGSPDRVYQWTVQDAGLGAWVRMRDGRVRAGRGTYARRRPFVHFVFPTLEGAFKVFTNTGSQMDAVAQGWVRPEGSPEYSRKISRLLQQADALLTEG
jgi:hypothetical protein